MKRKRPVEVCEKSTHICIEYFERVREDFGSIRRLYSFFDNENFLLSRYVVNNPSINTIIENRSGDQIWFSSINCGYNGEGPRGLIKLLIAAGIPEQKAAEWSLYRGMTIDFDFSQTKIQRECLYNIPFFGNDVTGKNNPFVFNKYSGVNVAERNIYMLNPQYWNMSGLFNVLHVMDPIRLEYCAGNVREYLKNDIHSDSIFGRSSPFQPEKTVIGANLVIYGNRFNLVCFISEDIVLSTVNTIYSYIMGNPLFGEKLFQKYGIINVMENPTLSKFDLIRNIILERNQEIREECDLEKRTVKQWPLNY